MSRSNKDSRGAELLRDMGVSQPELARQLGKASHVVVGHWFRGRSKPDAQDRKKISELFPIPVTAWDEPPQGPSPVTTSVAPAKPKPAPKKTKAPRKAKARKDVSALALATELRALAVDMLEEVRGTKVLTQKASAAKSLASVIAQLAKVTSEYGGAAKLSESPLVKRLIREENNRTSLIPMRGPVLRRCWSGPL